MAFTLWADHWFVNDDEIISGFTSLRDAIGRGFAHLERRMLLRLDALEARVARIERSAGSALDPRRRKAG